LYTPPRQRTRIVPHRPLTVGINDENGLPLGYGIIPNLSEVGACLWTNRELERGGRLVLGVSFGHPAEIHEIVAWVVWTREGEDPLGGPPMRRYGLQWQDFLSSYVVGLAIPRPRGIRPKPTRVRASCGRGACDAGLLATGPSVAQSADHLVPVVERVSP
jgi:hypothetical protein